MLQIAFVFNEGFWVGTDIAPNRLPKVSPPGSDAWV